MTGTTGILSWLNSDTGLGLLRNLLMYAGATLVTQGVISQGGLQDAVGAILVLLGLIFSAISNRNKASAKAIVQAVNDHPALAIIPADQTASGKPIVQIAGPMDQMIGGGFNAGPNPAMHAQ